MGLHAVWGLMDSGCADLRFNWFHKVWVDVLGLQIWGRGRGRREGGGGREREGEGGRERGERERAGEGGDGALAPGGGSSCYS